MSRKGSSGRRKSGGVVNMSPQDQQYIASLKENIEHETKRIPSFVHEDMTREEIQRVLRKEIERTGEPIAGVHPLEINGRFSKPKDEHFIDLVRGLNITRVKGNLEGRSREAEEFFISRADAIANRYSTKDLRRFVTEELGAKIRRGGRQEYITTIGLALMRRFNPREASGVLIRHSINVPTYRLAQVAGEIKQSIGRRATYRSRIAEIQAKYKGGKK